ncbi:hypothetical protein [Pseudomonas akapageensis]|uniref:hypothetical protein n=1 Tax=Pseudomonas akapageensis TaxID=2609961 RepID=UPI001408904D|nr:hypothetical protein [Pseudomonas akapageensis]
MQQIIITSSQAGREANPRSPRSKKFTFPRAEDALHDDFLFTLNDLALLTPPTKQISINAEGRNMNSLSANFEFCGQVLDKIRIYYQKNGRSGPDSLTLILFNAGYALASARIALNITNVSKVAALENSKISITLDNGYGRKGCMLRYESSLEDILALPMASGDLYDSSIIDD